MLSNCIMAGNSASSLGGGASGCLLNNCVLTNNSSLDASGGADDCVAINCTLVGNTAGSGGGAGRDSQLTNCIVYFNSASSGMNYDGFTACSYCCTTPQPTNGLGNITNAPLFINQNGGNLRLQSNSPCINSGNNAYVTTATDLDGNPRIAGGTVDIGAYEFQSPASLISYAWLQQFGLVADGSADFADPDDDGMNNWQEWIADTDPTNALSVLRMVSATNGPTGTAVSWQSVNTRSYFLQRTSDLGVQSAFITVATNIAGLSGTMTFTDTNGTGAGPFLYRVGVHQ